MAPPQSTILVLSQVYVPDPASVGQHMADAAEELARRGFSVRVLTSGRGYEDPSVRYAPRETRGGVDIVRLPLASFGKKTLLHRLLGQGLFLLQSIIRGVFIRRLTNILVSTSPPMCSFAALWIAALRRVTGRVKITYWVMDINPDQSVTLGRVSENSLAVRLFNRLNRRILARADDVVVLDRFMAKRIERKSDVRHKMSIIPPWPHEDELEVVPREENPFVEKHGLRDKFVIMYSGNHSIASPLTTLIEAALQLQDNPRLHFMFIGGGLGKKEVEETIEKHRPTNITSLPYQPLSQIKYSLSAGDVHVVSLGNDMVGIIHPCKVYGAMSVARPILMLGPTPSHVADLIDKYDIGWKIAYGDVDGAIGMLRRIANTGPRTLSAMGQTARRAIQQELSKSHLCGRFCDVFQWGVVPNAGIDDQMSHAHVEAMR